MMHAPFRKWLVYGLTALPVLLAAFGFLSLLSAPFTGAHWQQKNGGWVLSSVSHGTPAMAFNPLLDRPVLRLNGLAVSADSLVEDGDYLDDPGAWRRFWSFQEALAHAVPAGATLTVEVSGAEAVTVPTAAFPLIQALDRLWLLWLIAGVSLGLAGYLVLRRPQDQRAVVFFFLMLAVSLFTVSFDTFTARETAFPFPAFRVLWFINVLAGPSIFVLLLYFCLIFPTARWGLGRWWVLLLLAGPLAVAFLLQPVWNHGAYRWLLTGYRTAAGLFLLTSWVLTRSALERKQIAWVFWGFAVTAVPFLLTTLLPLRFFGTFDYSDRILLFLFPAIPLSIVLAISRYRLMDLDRVFGGLVVQVPVLAALVAFDGVLVALLKGFLGSEDGLDVPLISVLSLWVSLLAYAPLRQLVQGWVERLLLGRPADPQEALWQWGTTLLTTSLERTAEVGLGFLVTNLRAQGGAAFFASGQSTVELTGPFPDFYAWGQSLDRSTALYQWEERLRENTPILQEGVIVPLRGLQEYYGCYVLAARTGRRLYSRKELRVCDTAARMIVATLEKLSAQESARLEKERLSREIHDGVGGSFGNALMSLNLMLKAPRETPERREAQLVDLRTMMTENLSELRDLIWGIEERESTLGDLVGHASDKARRFLGPPGVVCSIEATLLTPEMPLTSAFRIQMIRILQESLSNLVIHSESRVAKLTFRQRVDRFEMTLRDEGRGFVPGAASSGYGLKNLQSRAADLGGTLVIESAPGRGAEVFLSVPLQPMGSTARRS